jgi:hypothetical protein
VQHAGVGSRDVRWRRALIDRCNGDALVAAEVVDVRAALVVVKPRQQPPARVRIVRIQRRPRRRVLGDGFFPQGHGERASARDDPQRGAVVRHREVFQQLRGVDEAARRLRRVRRHLHGDALHAAVARIEQHELAAARVHHARSVGRGEARVVLALVRVTPQIAAVRKNRIQVADPLVIGQKDHPLAQPHRPREVARNIAADACERASLP